MDKQIAGLLKQNESIYGSLKAKNLTDVLGELAIPDISLSQEEQKDFILKENVRLKELVKASKPPDEPKIPKIQIPKETKPQVHKPKEPKPDNSDQEDDDCECLVAPSIPKFSVIANMEDLKRAFFSREYTHFEELVKASPYKFFTANYKFASDKDGAPEYSARNLVKGFVRSFDDYRRYFMICFRCMQNPENVSTYSYPSIWIVNTNDPINSILGSTAEDFDFVEVTNEQLISDLLINIQKMNEETPNLIGEAYVH